MRSQSGTHKIFNLRHLTPAEEWGVPAANVSVLYINQRHADTPVFTPKRFKGLCGIASYRGRGGLPDLESHPHRSRSIPRDIYLREAGMSGFHDAQ